MQYDRLLDLALANSRKAKVWKNKPTAWSAVVDRLRTTTRTPETVAEYTKMSRDQQSDIKDVGGFVGGYCTNGNRSDVRHRSVICLDADYADASLWDDWQITYGNAAAIYSTHKHTPAKPRLRLVIPLSRNVAPDEYQAIARRVAYMLDIEKFDDTTYQPQRLMYWPSTSRDGVYVFDFLDAPFLDADSVLRTYHDWKDISAWPMSSRVTDISRHGEKQQNPTEKPGLIGAFCRAYSIDEAIEAFIPTYQPCAIPGRYTYTEGSTAAGVVTYDGLFSYSHHATDPASGQLVNAWDLVRLHRFGAQDADCAYDIKPSQRPSYKAMEALAAADKRVSAQVVADKLQAAQDDFTEPPAGETTDWKSGLKITQQGALAACIENVVLILKGDPNLAGAIALNEMSHDILAVKDLPWRKVRGTSQWTDRDDSDLRFYLERVYGISSKDKIFDAVNVVAGQNAFHPVREYLDTCTWDGVPRVDTLLIDYLGAEDTPYTRAVTRKALVAAVARIRRPGCKFDYMLTLKGRQGLGKSALIRKLGGQWFSDTFATIQGKEAYEQVLGVWIMEVGELAGMRRAEAETIKQYISKQSDRFRPAYGRRLMDFPRQCVFIATTNESEFLRDSTGNRRFWVVDTPEAPKKDLWADLTPDTVRLIWGEAQQRYSEGEELFLPRELEEEARRIQSSFEEESPRAGIIKAFLDKKLPEGWDDMDLYQRRDWLENGQEGTEPRLHVSTMEIWAEALNGNPDRLDRYGVKEIRDVLDTLPDWRRVKDRFFNLKPYGKQRYYERTVRR